MLTHRRGDGVDHGDNGPARKTPILNTSLGDHSAQALSFRSRCVQQHWQHNRPTREPPYRVHTRRLGTEEYRGGPPRGGVEQML